MKLSAMPVKSGYEATLNFDKIASLLQMNWIQYGVFNPAGLVLAGSGFKVTKPGAGQYQVTWATPRTTGTYAVVSNALAGTEIRLTQLKEVTTGGFIVWLHTQAFAPAEDCDITFVAIG